MITELTEIQKAEMEVYARKQIDRARSTQGADWEVAEMAAREMLRISKIDTPPEYLFIRCRNPILAAQAAQAMVGGEVSLFQGTSYFGGSCRNEFLVQHLGVRLDPQLEQTRQVLHTFLTSCGGAVFSESFTIIYDNPSILKLQDPPGGGFASLHCEDGPALAWGRGADGNYSSDDPYGYAMHYWEGIRVPSQWIEDKPTSPEELTARAGEVLSNENQEVLRAGCEILGWFPVLEALGMRVLNEDPNPTFGKLVSVDLPGSPDSRFLVAECGTGRTIAVPASPDAVTALEAGAMSYGVPVKLYRTLKVRT